MTRILKLQAENIKRLKAIEITPQGNVVVVGGRNGQGKSSTLDAIWYALGGAGSMPSEPLRKGEDAGFAKLDLDNGLIVTRRITDKGTTLKVETKDGVLKSPQAVLDRMVGSISFDPMAFVRMDPKKQLEALRKMVGLDFTELDSRREQVYAERTQANRLLRELEDQLAGLPEAEDAPESEVSVADLINELGAAESTLNSYEDRIDQRDRYMTAANDFSRQESQLKEQIARLQAEATDLHSKAMTQLGYAAVVEDGLGDIEVSRKANFKAVDAIKRRIAEADSVNQQVRANRMRVELAERIQRGQAKTSELSQGIASIDAAKAEQLAAAKFPVDGLSFGDDGVRFNGVPFEQASSAEQTRVSVGMALAMNPDLKVLLVRDGSLLDEESFALLAKMAADADAQVWVEAVTTDRDKCAVVIEDGSVQVAP